MRRWERTRFKFICILESRTFLEENKPGLRIECIKGNYMLQTFIVNLYQGKNTLQLMNFTNKYFRKRENIAPSLGGYMTWGWIESKRQERTHFMLWRCRHHAPSLLPALSVQLFPKDLMKTRRYKIQLFPPVTSTLQIYAEREKENYAQLQRPFRLTFSFFPILSLSWLSQWDKLNRPPGTDTRVRAQG